MYKFPSTIETALKAAAEGETSDIMDPAKIGYDTPEVDLERLLSFGKFSFNKCSRSRTIPANI